MGFLISHESKRMDLQFKLSGSKSESNRLLILKSLFRNMSIKNISRSNDTLTLIKNLENLNSRINVGHAGTAMRFLTAFLSIQKGKTFEIFGSERMHKRPIGPLVEALNSIGANIKYLEKKGFPPLKIEGKKMKKNNLSIRGNVSSQFISALLLISPMFEKGLNINIEGDITSKPYLDMTLFFLKKLGVKTIFEKNKIQVFETKRIKDFKYEIESDWSSLSYFFSIVSLSQNASLRISNFRKNTIQGDKRLIQIYERLGVTSSFYKNSIILTKDSNNGIAQKLNLDLNDCPDIAQTIAVNCFGLGIPCDLFGLHTLKIKETDRLLALKNELEKLGASIKITENSLHLSKSKNINSNVKIRTYDDHRMAMSFAPLGLKTPIIIENPNVVEKSFSDFWDILKDLKFEISKSK